MAEMECYAAPMVKGDSRIEGFFDAAEKSLGQSLNYIIEGNTWEGPIEDRIARVNASLPWASKASSWRNPLLGNGISGKGHALTMLKNVMGAKEWSDGLVSKFKVNVDDESDLPNLLPKCLQEVAVAVSAYSGFVHSAKAAGQIVSDGYCKNRLEDGILHFTDRRIAIFGLSWVNYLDAAIATRLGFPSVEDRQRLASLHEVPHGGWLFSLTAEPLDLDVSSHREAIHWAFDRFSNQTIAAR